MAGALTLVLNTKQLDHYVKGLERMGRDLPSTIDRAVNLTANEGKAIITPKTPKITGNLRRGFQVQKIGKMLYRIYNIVDYFMFIETGKRVTKGYKIRITKKMRKFLHASGIAHPRKATKYIHYPAGTIKRKKGAVNMMKRSVKQIWKRFDRNLSRAIKMLLSRKF